MASWKPCTLARSHPRWIQTHLKHFYDCTPLHPAVQEDPSTRGKGTRALHLHAATPHFSTERRKGACLPHPTCATSYSANGVRPLANTSASYLPARHCMTRTRSLLNPDNRSLALARPSCLPA